MMQPGPLMGAALALALAAPAAAGTATHPEPRDFVVLYAREPDLERLEAFDLAILDPDVALPDSALRAARTELLGYVSVGEVAPDRPERDDEAVRALAVAENPEWKSLVMDLSRPEWRAFVLDRLVPRVCARGFAGLFLDTLDAVDLLAARDPARAAAYRDGLVELVAAIRAAHPEARIIANRGLSVIERIAPYIDGVMVESVFRSFDPKTGAYVAVPFAASAALAERLTAIERDLGLTVYVLDYAADPEAARDAVARIRAAGFIPYVSTPDLEAIAPWTVAPWPRRVIALYDGEEQPRPVDSLVYGYLAMPLGWLGVAVDYVDANGPLPEGPLAGRYRGVVTYFRDDRIGDPERLVEWLAARRAEGIRLVVMNRPGVGARHDGTPASGAEDRLWELLGLRAGAELAFNPADLAFARLDSAMVGFEAPLRHPAQHFREIEALGAEARVHLRVERRAGGLPFDAVVTSPAGGIALAPYLQLHRPDKTDLWYLDVFAFLSTALGLDGGECGKPALDATTLDGSRILLSHIDGDGFPNRSELHGHPRSGVVIRDEILERYPIPVTVSVVEGEIGAAGVRPAESAELEALARTIFELPWVEAACHSFSHPFYWDDSVPADAEPYPQRHLPVPGYAFSLEREIDGAVRYVEGLLPPGKKVEVYLWSGNCLPGEAAVARVDALGLENMNGGDTVMGERYPSYTAVAPLVAPWGSTLQVLAPNQNENVYTERWTGPQWSYLNALDTFKATESPRRVKPIDIYYHYYSGDSWGSLRAVREVYDRVLSQEVAPRHVSEYTRLVRDFRTARIDELAGGGYRIRSAGLCRTVRFDGAAGGVDLERSRGVLGWRVINGALYVDLDGTGRADIHLTSNPPARPYLVRASHRPRGVETTGERIAFTLGGLGPVACRLGGFAPGEALAITIDGRARRGRADPGGELDLELPAGVESRVEVRRAGDA